MSPVLSMNSKNTKLPEFFYLRDDVVRIARELIGKYIFTRMDGVLTGGIITEIEAYKAPEDKASHAYNYRKTQRTKIFYRPGGIAYVYLCYGIHNLCNIITGDAETPHAVLIRSFEPTVGIEEIFRRRNRYKLNPVLTCGPGSLSQALGIGKIHNGISICKEPIWLEEGIGRISDTEIIAGPRVGIDYAEEYVLKPWRFGIKDSKWISRPLLR